ncbi:MAG TPA: 2-dehydropantoate 2-reductase [Polyangia bacterium]|jgi:2-dehydropantoate 2-reductase
MPDGKLIGVIGAGPVGSILSAHLAQAGHQVVLVECGARRYAQLQEHGITVSGTAEISRQAPIVLPRVEALADYQLAYLFICTKAWSLKTLLPTLVTVITGVPIVSFQNGIGPEDEIAAVFPAEDVCRGIVNFAGGVNPVDGHVTMHWFNPPNYIGPLNGGHVPLAELADMMTRAGLKTKVVSSHEIKKEVFYKTILNSALNALCASSGITMRQAMSLPHTRNLAHLLIREGLSVASAVGYYYGESPMEACLRYLNAGGDHLPSMWVDLERGMRTEIEYINGRIVQIGAMFKNVDVDVNIFFTSMIVTQEIKSGVRTADDIPEYLAHT